ncbi:hypothetical protein [Bacillus badius]|uniref:Uncharacterized protein n=1 Tax=Bacillus badius TaxID=1455 RepID=A0ABR5ANL2_BACBA|nr:hypothetical protein [Bacillus badius]KIL72134.1 hypothetical protein SD77_3537 [Bacillus badius]MED4718615.1 hypothetical protein [Bacillus badius]
MNDEILNKGCALISLYVFENEQGQPDCEVINILFETDQGDIADMFCDVEYFLRGEFDYKDEFITVGVEAEFVKSYCWDYACWEYDTEYQYTELGTLDELQKWMKGDAE